MYANKDYRNSDAKGLTSYISRDEHQLMNRSGEEMGGDEQEEFIEKSEKHKYNEQWVISPENGDELSDDELSLAARKTMSDHLENRPTADYCFAVHRDTENPHVQVAVTGEKSDLWTESDDLQRFREAAIEHTNEQEESIEAEIMNEHESEQSEQHEQDQGQSRGLR